MYLEYQCQLVMSSSADCVFHSNISLLYKWTFHMFSHSFCLCVLWPHSVQSPFIISMFRGLESHSLIASSLASALGSRSSCMLDGCGTSPRKPHEGPLNGGGRRSPCGVNPRVRFLLSAQLSRMNSWHSPPRWNGLSIPWSFDASTACINISFTSLLYSGAISLDKKTSWNGVSKLFSFLSISCSILWISGASSSSYAAPPRVCLGGLLLCFAGTLVYLSLIHI